MSKKPGLPELFAPASEASAIRLRRAARDRCEQRRRIAKWSRDAHRDTLLLAGAHGDLAEVERLLAAGANPNCISKEKTHGALPVAAD